MIDISHLVSITDIKTILLVSKTRIHYRYPEKTISSTSLFEQSNDQIVYVWFIPLLESNDYNFS
jgi:hypothetical protein